MFVRFVSLLYINQFVSRTTVRLTELSALDSDPLREIPLISSLNSSSFSSIPDEEAEKNVESILWHFIHDVGIQTSVTNFMGDTMVTSMQDVLSFLKMSCLNQLYPFHKHFLFTEKIGLFTKKLLLLLGKEG